ncbi:hypothetical protein LSUB1_G007523, partial [Lachnellula subtilissima]
MLERLTICFINIFSGPNTDCLINTLLFIAGVIPGHIHGFYISCTYFHRKRKVRKGRWPGGRKAGIYSRAVWNGGASDARVRELYERARGRDEESGRRRSGKMQGGG